MLKYFIQFGLNEVNTLQVFRLLLLTWLVTKLISFKLWFQLYRVFPRITAVDFIDFEALAFVDVSLAFISFLCIAFSLYKINSKIILSFIFIEIVLCFFDVIRIQPLQFQMILLSFIYVLQPKKFNLNLLLLLSATYLFAGLCKFNLGFINVNWSYLFLEQTLGIQRSFTQIPIIKALGFIIPFLETLAGIVLLTKYRKIACIGLIVFHLATLVYISPFHLALNHAVWPWNLSMILLLFYFAKQRHLSFNQIHFKAFYQKIYLSFLFVFPILGFTNYYHPYAAFQLYQGKDTYLIMQSASNKLAAFHQEKYQKLMPENQGLYTSLCRQITFSEFNVPVASIPWLHKKIKQTVRSKMSFGETRFYSLPYPYRKVVQIVD
ncbi:hypothetical protein [Psychroflexus salis]|uniref:Uncharacterized protein n=1 Tax=Psychroflexus salis TaxID=1526574 RepID=A0A916ZMV0_9FLAO|nr:hypothetical protein [Psychroflexus salis]GGE05181.1 hypothetical protein GCM10010831_03550 [Psychroflexus salis]